VSGKAASRRIRSMHPPACGSRCPGAVDVALGPCCRYCEGALLQHVGDADSTRSVDRSTARRKREASAGKISGMARPPGPHRHVQLNPHPPRKTGFCTSSDLYPHFHLVR
jgi:hypothetical protein